LNFVAVIEQADWQRESWNDRGDVAEAFAILCGLASAASRKSCVASTISTNGPCSIAIRFQHGRWDAVTLLGDACHPMLPYMAQGAAQAIEDGAVLAACLRCVPDLSVEDALKRYEGIRKPRASEIQALARRNAQTFHLHDGSEQQARDGRMAAHAGGRDVASVSPARSMIFAYDAMQERSARQPWMPYPSEWTFGHDDPTDLACAISSFHGEGSGNDRKRPRADFNGAATASCFLIACGLSITMGLMGFTNSSAWIDRDVRGYLVVALMKSFGWPFLATIPAAFVVCALVGLPSSVCYSSAVCRR